jgi:hypothetical protein
MNLDMCINSKICPAHFTRLQLKCETASSSTGFTRVTFSSNKMPFFLDTLDEKIASTLAQWNIITTLLAVFIVAFLAYPVLYPDEPDTHPLLLARQASASPVRQRGESAVYRCPEIPHGYPLKSGLNVKGEGEPRWKSGRDGDLRDVWREVTRGGKSDAEGKTIPAGLIMSVFGKEEVEEHEIAKLSKEINVLGAYWKANGVHRVAIYLPNSAEYLLAIFGELCSSLLLRV